MVTAKGQKDKPNHKAHSKSMRLSCLLSQMAKLKMKWPSSNHHKAKANHTAKLNIRGAGKYTPPTKFGKVSQGSETKYTTVSMEAFV